MNKQESLAAGRMSRSVVRDKILNNDDDGDSLLMLDVFNSKKFKNANMFVLGSPGIGRASHSKDCFGE